MPQSALQHGMVKKVLRRTAMALAALIVLGILFILEENIRGRIQLNAYKKELRAKGEKLTLEELDLPKAPKENNGAEAFLQAANELEKLKDACPAVFSGVGSIHQGYVPGRKHVLTMEKEILVISKTNSWDDLSKEIKEANPVLAKMREALKQPSLAVDLNYKRAFENPVPHLAKLRASARSLWVAALNDLHQKNLNGALQNNEALADLVRFQKNERLVISQLVRIAVGGIALNTPWEILQSPDLTDTQLEQLQHTCQMESILGDMKPCFEVERALSDNVFSLLQKSAKKRWEMVESLRMLESFGISGETQWGLHSNFIMRIRSFLWWIAWSHQDELHNLQEWQTLIDGGRLGTLEKSWLNAGSLIYRKGKIQKHGFYDQCRFMFSLDRTPLQRTFLSVVRFETQRELTVTAIALKRYQLRHGKQALSLSSLVPEFLPDLPRDYMDGKPLRYRLRQDGSFTLYSVGENGRDDGGDPNSPPEKKDSKNMWYGLDLVWPMPATQEEVEAAEAAAKK